MPLNGKLRISVSVRVRPSFDNNEGGCSPVKVTGPNISVCDRMFRYPAHVVCGKDQVSANMALADHMMRHLDMDYSCTLLAYGQTGSGKTHTIFGPPGSLTESALRESSQTPTSWGIFPRFMMSMLNSGRGTLHVSAIEIYDEVAFDLLSDRTQLRIGSLTQMGTVVPKSALPSIDLITGEARDTRAGYHPSCCTCYACFKAKSEAKKKKKKTNIGRKNHNYLRRQSNSSNGNEEFKAFGEKAMAVKTPSDVARISRTIEQTRSAKGHKLNERSSRSHCLVRVAWKRGDRVADCLFVDLAGSERIKKSGSTGQKKIEAASINKSLTCLGRCITRLLKNDNHIPFRDSTLTRLLKPSLGGRCATSVIVTLSPEAQHADETMCSLRFGERMSGVENAVAKSSRIDVARERENVERRLKRKKAELKRLYDAGQGTRTDQKNSAARHLLEENMEKLKVHEKRVADIRVELAEAGGAVGGKRTSEVIRLEMLLGEAEKAKSNHADVVFRQKTIKGLHIEPSRAYKRTEADIRQLQDKLRLLSL